MSLIESLIYGFVSGLAEIFPVSAQANQMVMRYLMGIPNKEPIRDLLVHIAILISVFIACRGMFAKIRREQVLAYRMRRNPSQVRALKGVYDMRFVKSAAPIMIIGLFLGFFLPDFFERRPLFSLILLINGVITIIPIYLHQGNRDARSLSGIDSFLIGIAAALSAIPGISRNGAIMAATVIREADKHNAVNWSFMLAVPAMVVMIFLDFIAIFTVGIGNVVFLTFIGYLLSACAAFVGTYLASSIIKVVIQRSDYTAFAYYDFGLALFSFIMYLIT